MKSNYEKMIDQTLVERGLSVCPRCPKCDKQLGFVDGAWICFTRWQDCGIMMEGYFTKEGEFVANE